MAKTSLLTQLAIAGIAAGLVSVTPVHAADKSAKADASVQTEKSGLGKKVAADTMSAVAAFCRGKNACKGQGGCSMSDKALKAQAKKLGIPLSKAGKAHSCKGKNECKGLGGCSM